MKEILLKEINTYFNQIASNESDSENLVNIKTYLKGESLFNVLNYLVETSESIKNLVISNFEKMPEVYADIVSSIDNPNCSCRNRVHSYFSSNFDPCKNLFLELFQNNIISENDLETVKEMVESYMPQLNNRYEDYSGKVVEIENNSEDYSQFIKNLKESGNFYQGISIIENNNKLKLFFY
jgi:uncharacterized protein YutE (UPF0331/DUF86 family)